MGIIRGPQKIGFWAEKKCFPTVVQDVPGTSPAYLVILGGSGEAWGPILCMFFYRKTFKKSEFPSKSMKMHDFS